MPMRVGRPGLDTATPAGFTRYAQGSKVPAALLLFVLVAGVRSVRLGRTPTPREAAGLLVASLAIAVAASFVPDLVVAFLAALLFVVAIDEERTIVRAADWLSGLLGPVGTPVARPLTRGT